MKRIAKYWHLCLTAVLVMGFSACTEEYEYDPTTDTDNQGAYMQADETTLILTEEDPQQLSFTVSRHDDTSAATYRLYTDNDGFQIPQEVNFAAGEKSQTFTVNFNVPSGTVQQRVVIGIQEEDAYTYGAHSLTFTISRLKRIDNCQMLGIRGIWVGAALWNMSIYEYGKSVDEDGTVLSTSYLVKDPYNYDEVGLPADCVGQNNQFSFTIHNDNTATMGTGTNSLFYCSANFTGDPSVVGDLIVSGSGTYYTDRVQLVEGFYASNFVLFNWESRIGTTNYGFGTCTHAIIFPDGYDPLTQTQTTQD